MGLQRLWNFPNREPPEWDKFNKSEMAAWFVSADDMEETQKLIYVTDNDPELLGGIVAQSPEVAIVNSTVLTLFLQVAKRVNLRTSHNKKKNGNYVR